MANLLKGSAGEGRLTARHIIRRIGFSFVIGVVSIGVAWGSAGLTPVNEPDPGTGESPSPSPSASPQEAPDAGAAAAPSIELDSGRVLAGAAKISLEPRPQDYDGTWETDRVKCATLSPDPAGLQEGATHVADFRVRWAENPNCIYMGGYGLGPMNPIVDWDDEYGLWVRSVALGDGADTVVLTLIDAVYWEAYYDNLCEDCGFMDLADQLAEDTGLPPDSFIFASTHSHTSPDFIGGWGGVPKWYMQQASDSLKAAATAAVESMEPAVIEAGDVVARQFNGERRDFYRSAEDDTMSWFRLIDADGQPGPEVCTIPKPGKDQKPQPACEPGAPGRAIATVGAYPAHPVTAEAETGIGDADFPAVFARRVEERFGGVGMFLQTGLGNMSPRGDKVAMGDGLASLLPAIGEGTTIETPDVVVGRTEWDQPVTNVPLGALGVTGFFDRRFNQLPASIAEGKGPENKKCRSASEVSVNTTVSAAKVGSLWITGGPGELFANLTNAIEERNPRGVTLALGLVNDGLGYIVQSFETDHLGRQGTGFVGGAGPAGVAEYEDAYSIDHCFGDAVLEKTISLLDELG